MAACNVSPIVRIRANEGWMVKRALDAGAHGIIVPLLRSGQDAEMLVQAAKSPPYGKRGFGSPFSMGSFDGNGDLSGFDYKKTPTATSYILSRSRPRKLWNAWSFPTLSLGP
ncbi:uncharacterized protein Z520_07025 [Fonsecaea multimorphosa CBS 102226]|uniref:HpcH/HpaI aldolase/citrate lyase domain-containing protein n=1 Tax=Fonsecaea multimorphosa CBS 102226 TaxID=1442371 RepID=A0A0D2JVS8_9EURO|nr:uncharacterized protein Z520_07025 [Fonsecaea multimorphosa CBS 102226]KIX97572.1 hypothetical protein Z520_07025 [Fonsecaea multimorphosa CBS 102226]